MGISKIKNTGLRLSVVLLLSVLLMLAPYKFASADVEACNVDVTPDTVQPNSRTLFNFSIRNDGSNPITWIKILRPSSNFDISNAIWAGSTSVSNDQAELFGGNDITPGSTFDVGINVHAGEDQSSGDNWTIMVSDSSDGSSPTTCGGSHTANVAGERVVDPDTTPPIIDQVKLSKLKSTSVVVSWTTDEPANSDVSYGETDSYGLAEHTADFVNTHSLTLENLTPDTAYHFLITSYDSSGNGASYTDSTFLTASDEGTPTATPTSSALSTTAIPLKVIPTEKVPPTISLTSNISKPQLSSPVLTGTADDNEALAGVYYSLDNGKNWLPVDFASGLGTKKATFSFTPANLDDGNYDLVLSAIDTSGNVGKTAAAVLIIDRLPPMVGGNILSLGPQIMKPDADGTLSSLVSVDQKITMSAVGGPINIALTAKNKDKNQIFNLTKSTESGLWSGVISFAEAGEYELSAKSLDGAGNETTRQLNNIRVKDSGHTVDATTKKPIKSTVTLYYLEPASNAWTLWEGESYGQKNPQSSDAEGSFELFLPPGKYYLKAAAKGYKTLTSSIFETKISSPLTTQLKLESIKGFSLFSLKTQKITLSKGSQAPTKKNQQASLIGKITPDFKLKNTDGVIVRSADLLGKPTVISFEATWSPNTQEQLSALAKAQENKEVNVIPVALQEDVALVQAYTSRSGLSLRWLVDPDSTLSSTYGVESLPTHYFVDRKGVIKSIEVGVLTEKQLLDKLSRL